MSDDQDFFCGPTLFQPILAARDAGMTAGGRDNGKAHLDKLTDQPQPLLNGIIETGCPPALIDINFACPI